LSADLALKHIRLNFYGTYNRKDLADANQTTLASVWNWLKVLISQWFARHGLGMSRSWASHMMGLEVAPAAAAIAGARGADRLSMVAEIGPAQDIENDLTKARRAIELSA
jgi:hypothetical protein